MKFSWLRRRSSASALDDLLRAIEYAEAQEMISGDPRTSGLSRTTEFAELPAAACDTSAEFDGPPYGRGI
jgi:hypothetical protein